MPRRIPMITVIERVYNRSSNSDGIHEASGFLEFASCSSLAPKKAQRTKIVSKPNSAH